MIPGIRNGQAGDKKVAGGLWTLGSSRDSGMVPQRTKIPSVTKASLADKCIRAITGAQKANQVIELQVLAIFNPIMNQNRAIEFLWMDVGVEVEVATHLPTTAMVAYWETV